MTSTKNTNGFEAGKVNSAQLAANAAQQRSTCQRSSRRRGVLGANGGVRESLVCRENTSYASEQVPIWLAALIATCCQATGSGEDHDVRWNCIAGRAVYTNAGVDTELIQPLGVRLLGGQTVAVSWLPGETEYTVEVLRSHEIYA